MLFSTLSSLLKMFNELISDFKTYAVIKIFSHHQFCVYGGGSVWLDSVFYCTNIGHEGEIRFFFFAAFEPSNSINYKSNLRLTAEHVFQFDNNL